MLLRARPSGCFSLHVASRSSRALATLAGPEPEYASSDLSGYNLFSYDREFDVQCGTLPRLDVAWESWGTLNKRKDNAILLTCGMSASSHARSHPENDAPGWWEKFIGPGLAIDTNLFYVICTNNLGGCYGSTGPSSKNPATGKPWGGDFPLFSVTDMVRAQMLLVDDLGISKLHAVVGSSLGGMLSLATAARYPDRVGKFVTISACAKSYPGSIAFRYCQRNAIMSDPNWKGGHYYEGPAPDAGLKCAREIGTITYRSGPEWEQRFGQGTITDDFSLEPYFQIENYLRHQGNKWVGQFDPNSMLYISKAMDAFSLEVDSCLASGLSAATQPALVVGVQSDRLFPIWQQKLIADTLKQNGNKHVAYYELDALYGHDTFLLDVYTVGGVVKGHLEQEPNGTQRLWEDAHAAASVAALDVLAKLCDRDKSDSTVKELFTKLDEAKNGGVPMSQMSSVMRMLYGHRLSADSVKLMEKDLEASAVDGLVTKESFVELMRKHSPDSEYYTVI